MYRLCLLPFLACCLCSSSFAQTVGISLVELQLQEHLPVVVESGTEFSLQLRAPGHVPPNFHVRVFRGDRDRLTKGMKAFADSDGCITYSSAVIWGRVDAAVHLQGLESLGWLKISNQGKFEAENLTIVFEAGDSPVASQIRLHTDQVDAYFRYSVPIRLIPSANAQSATAQIIQATRHQLQSTATQFQELPKGPCYQVQTGLSADGNELPPSIREVAAVQPTPCTGTVNQNARSSTSLGVGMALIAEPQGAMGPSTTQLR